MSTDGGDLESMFRSLKKAVIERAIGAEASVGASGLAD